MWDFVSWFVVDREFCQRLLLVALLPRHVVCLPALLPSCIVNYLFFALPLGFSLDCLLNYLFIRLPLGFPLRLSITCMVGQDPFGFGVGCSAFALRPCFCFTNHSAAGWDDLYLLLVFWCWGCFCMPLFLLVISFCCCSDGIILVLLVIIDPGFVDRRLWCLYSLQVRMLHCEWVASSFAAEVNVDYLFCPF